MQETIILLYWVFPKMVGFPNNHGVFLRKMIILWCFGGTTIFGNIHMTTWNMDLHLPHDKWLGKYSSPMDPMGMYIIYYTSTS